jgi:hypothetical protein
VVAMMFAAAHRQCRFGFRAALPVTASVQARWTTRYVHVSISAICGTDEYITCVLSGKRALSMLKSSSYVIFHLRVLYDQVAETASPSWT